MKITTAYKMERERLVAFETESRTRQFAPLINQMVGKLHVEQLLDYGSGNGELMKHLQANHAISVQCYDPAIPDFAGDPIPMQMGVCIDVLQCVEPECLDEVLDDLKVCFEVVGFISVQTVESEKTLSDGRNANLIVEEPEWWLPKIMERFELQTFQRVTNGFYVIVYSKQKQLIELPHEPRKLQ